MTEANEVPRELLRRAADADQGALADLLTPYRGRLKRMVKIRLNQRLQGRVLLRHAAQDARMLSRFRRECRAAAQLHHTNIVPVFEVGQQGDICYYAMQFIRGQALDEVFRQLQHLQAGRTPATTTEVTAPAAPLAQSLWTGEFEPAAARDAVDHESGTAPTPPGAGPQAAESSV